MFRSKAKSQPYESKIFDVINNDFLPRINGSMWKIVTTTYSTISQRVVRANQYVLQKPNPNGLSNYVPMEEAIEEEFAWLIFFYKKV